MEEISTAEALIDVMNELVDDELELKRQLKDVEKKKDEIQYQMEQLLLEKKQDVITVGYWSFGWDYKKRTAFDQKAFKEKHPDLYEEFKTEKEYKSFQFGHKED